MVKSVATLSTGGGSSAPAASAHSGCPRFVGTDPLVTGISRRDVARDLGSPDIGGAIPEARWVRAMTFERLVQQQPLATRFVTMAMGLAGLARPAGVVAADPLRRRGQDADAIGKTAGLLAEAHERAVTDDVATLVHTLTIPFPGIDQVATPTKPDFAIVAPSETVGHSWLLMGDAKDYERVRSRIDDQRLLKGFLQVALGAEAARQWNDLPGGMDVSEFGVLAVPRNSFLQPTPVVERLRDYEVEILDRLGERLAALSTAKEATDVKTLVDHLRAEFNPVECASCPLFRHCRNEIRSSTDPADVLVELGVPKAARPGLVDFVAGGDTPADAAESLVENLRATMTGVPQRSEQRRVGFAGAPGTVNVVIAKSDGGSLGVHGIALRRVAANGPVDWEVSVFPDPLADTTRRSVMRALGKQLVAAMREMKTAGGGPDPIHIVVPDKSTADLLVSIADNLAGIELSRLRWERDLDRARPALTFDGEPAKIPKKLNPHERKAVSFLLEADRSRAITLRSAIVDLGASLRRNFVAGGPVVNSMRLDYLVGWTEADQQHPIDHRAFADGIEDEEHTPGTRPTNVRSDEIFHAQSSKRGGDAARYDDLVRDELGYKQGVVDRAIRALETLGVSRVRPAYGAIEGDAQEVWRRRNAFEAGDLVRFGRVYDHWRNIQVRQIDADTRCAAQLSALSDPRRAQEMAHDAGNRDLLTGRVIATSPLAVEVHSRRIADGDVVVILHVNSAALAEEPTVALTVLKGSFKFEGMPIGAVRAVAGQGRTFEISLPTLLPLPVTVGDLVVLATQAFFRVSANRKSLSVERPSVDDQASPKPGCTPHSYDDDPVTHKWCCRPHTGAEAEWSDELAKRRSEGKLNPQVWPPAIDEDGFEVVGIGQPTADTVPVDPTPAPTDLSISDID